MLMGMLRNKSVFCRYAVSFYDVFIDLLVLIGSNKCVQMCIFLEIQLKKCENSVQLAYFCVFIK